MFEMYLEETREALVIGGFDALAHLDLIYRYVAKHLGSVPFSYYEDTAGGLLELLVKKNIALEINTSGLRQPAGRTFPPFEAVLLYRQLGGRMLTVGSDAHHVQHVGAGLEEAMQMVARAGIEQLGVFEGRLPHQVCIAGRLNACKGALR
jgi:histidinol-phosphatase (PHP family)